MANLLFPLLLVVLLVPMFLGVRRQKREAAKVTAMQEGVKTGDQITTTSGMYGTVVDVDDETIDLEIAEDVVTTWLRAAVRDVRISADSGDVDASDDSADSDDSVDSADSADAELDSSADADRTAALAGATAADVREPVGEAAAGREESVEDTAARLRKD